MPWMAAWQQAAQAGSRLLFVLLAATLPPQCVALQAAARAKAAATGPLSGMWFGSQGESTPDAGVGERRMQGGHDGWEYGADNPYASAADGRSATFYTETASGAWKEAWQTNYPASHPTGAWRLTDGGHWEEDYNHVRKMGPTKIRSAWFDASVANRDEYGRLRAPDPDSPERNLFWEERAVNTTLTCDTVGCTGAAFLQAFDPSREEVSHCKLSFFLHPTDFDDLYSGERLTWIKVNDQVVNTDCFPMISGCNEASQAPLYPCVQDLVLDSILDASGVVNVSAQISDTVDECPYEGHLLAAVPMVTCQVIPKATSPPTAVATVPLPVPAMDLGAPTFAPVSTAMPLRCMERGCVAHTSLVPDRETEALFRTLPVQCLMSVTLYQTDFDGEEGTPELLEYLRVNESTVLSDFAPGSNPCRSSWFGTPLPADKMSISLLRNQDVTALYLGGGLNIDGKITEFVDECAHNGYLLDGLVELRCDLNASVAPLEPPASPPPPPAPASESTTTPPPPSTPSPPPPAPQPLPMSTAREPAAMDPALAPTAAPLPPPTQTPVPVPAQVPLGAAPPENAEAEQPLQSPPAESGITSWGSAGQQTATAPFGSQDTALMLEEHSQRTQDTLVDAVENAQVAEIKRAVFRALTRLRASQIKEFDTIARIESQAMDEFNDNHHFRKENPLTYIHENEPAVSVDRFSSFHGGT